MLLGAARLRALKNLSAKGRSTVVGAPGSSAAVMLSGLPYTQGHPILVVGDSLDDAGYLYFDLCRLAGEDAVAMLPSGFKRDIKYGQIGRASWRERVLSHV